MEDVSNPPLAKQNSYLQPVALRRAARCRNARSLLRRDESKFSGATGLMVSNSHGRQRVEFSGLHILRELPVPCLPIELRKPSAEHRELFGRHPLNFGLDPLNATHILTPACHAISSQQPATGPALRGSA